MKIEKNRSLENFNTYKIKAKAKFFTEAKNAQELAEVFAFIKKEKIKKFFVLGSGANIIFKNDFYDGMIIHITGDSARWSGYQNVKVGAGRIWDKFLWTLYKRDYFEIQSLALIPGTVGAAIYGNIGAFGSEVKKYVKKVEVFDTEAFLEAKRKSEEMVEEKYIKYFSNEEMDFSYRNSLVKKTNSKYIITRVFFDFSEKFAKEMKKFYKDDEYFSLEHFAKKHNLGDMKAKKIRKNIIKIREEVYPDIEKFPNVGSTFKNTEITKKELKNILRKYPEIPNWEMDNGNIKIPTAYILDKVLGLNGEQFGNIKIHPERPLFFMNMGGATGDEFYKLCQKVKKMTKAKLGIDIEEEVVYIK